MRHHAMHRLSRLLHRAPIFFHRFGVRGYERLLGIDWILVTTRGRRTGRPHSVMLDIVGYDPATDSYYVQPADPGSAQWVRNVEVQPLVEAAARGRSFKANVREVTGPEGAEVVLRFVREHPWYARLIVWLVGYVETIDLPDDELRAQLARTPVYAIETRTR
jgi:deazaflavin-dependent oxidoreductase (nitroreductase family)